MDVMYVKPSSLLWLGRTGENNAREIVFDIHHWQDEYGLGIVELIVKRPGEESMYPVAVEMEGGFVHWVISSADVEYAGTDGRAELRYYVGDTLVKSKIWVTSISQSLELSKIVPPEPQQSWIDQVIQAGADAKAAALDAKTAAESASESAEKLDKAIPAGGTAGQVLTKLSNNDLDTGWMDPAGGGNGGMPYQIGHGLKLESNTLSVNAVNDFEGDNTLPITAAAVEATVGNIEILLGTI